MAVGHYGVLQSSTQATAAHEVPVHALLVWIGKCWCSPQQDQIPTQREAGYTIVYTDETYVHTSQSFRNADKTTLLD